MIYSKQEAMIAFEGYKSKVFAYGSFTHGVVVSSDI